LGSTLCLGICGRFLIGTIPQESMEGLLEKMALSIEDIRRNQDKTMNMVCQIAARMDLPDVAAGIATRDLKMLTVGTHQQMCQDGKELHHHVPAGYSQSCPPDVLFSVMEGNDGYASSSRHSSEMAAKSRPNTGVRKLIAESHTSASPSSPDLRQQKLPEATQLMAKHIVSCTYYPYAMGLVIFANMMSIGFETQFLIDGTVMGQLHILNQFCFAIYVIDLILNLVVYGRECFSNGWFIFDFVLVLIHLVNVVLLMLIAGHSKSISSFFFRLMVVRMFRTLRLLRALRLIKQFRTMWRMVYGLLTSFQTLLSALSLIGMALFVFGCLGVDLVTLDNESFATADLQDIVNTYFSSLPTTILFLVQFVTMDSIAAVYMPLVKAKPLLALYFAALLLVVSIALMNMVLANIVEQALHSAHSDKELESKVRRQQIKEMIPILEEIFNNLSRDSKSLLTLDQLMEIDMSKLPESVQEYFRSESVADLFDILDIDRSGEVSKEEFIEGIMSFCISAEPATSFHMRKVLELLRFEVRQISKDFGSFRSGILKKERLPDTVTV